VDISKFSHPRKWVALALAMTVAATVALVVTGTTSANGKKAKAAPRVAFLLPENVTPRWQGSDAPVFKAALAKLVPGVQVDVVNALNDPAKQQQAEAEMTKGAKVLVI
jgi:D-xylose transport system substrate-binding protein